MFSDGSHFAEFRTRHPLCGLITAFLASCRCYWRTAKLFREQNGPCVKWRLTADGNPNDGQITVVCFLLFSHKLRAELIGSHSVGSSSSTSRSIASCRLANHLLFRAASGLARRTTGEESYFQPPFHAVCSSNTDHNLLYISNIGQI